ncbi:MAG: CDP-alcohol phosphatidyltransferase family protein [Bryobacteraceae bacterium]
MTTIKKERTFAEAERAQVSLLAPLEKRCLLWLARHTPSFVNPDHLTALGLLALAAAGLAYWYARWNRAGLVIVIACLALNWLGDSLDGTLARVRNRQRPKYGFYVDHAVDMLGTFFLLYGLGQSGYMSERIATGLLIVYFMLTIEVYLATYTLGTFHLSFWKFSPTELRVLLMIGNVALLYRPVVGLAGGRYRLFDVGGLVGIVGMSLMLATSIIRHTAALYRAERVP